MTTETKRIPFEQLVANIKADLPALLKPPIGLRPRHLVVTLRILEILEALHRYVGEGKQVPHDWWNELTDLIVGEEYVVS